MPVEIRELVIQAKLREDTKQDKKSAVSTKSKSSGCCQSSTTVTNNQDLKEEIIEYLKEYFYNERLR